MDSWSKETNSPSEDVSFYLSWLNKAQSGIGIATVFSYHPPVVVPPPSYGRSLTLYSSLWTILVLHLLLIHAYTWVHVPLAAPSDVLWVAMTQIALFRGHVHINGARMLVVGIYCGGDNLSWNCSSTILPWLTHCTYAFPWDDLGDYPWWCAAFSFRDLGLPRTGLSSVTSPSSLDLTRSSSNISFSSALALDLIWNWPRLPNSSAPQSQFAINFFVKKSLIENCGLI